MSKKMNNKMSLISGGMLLLAVFSFWPYGFYQILRLVVCLTGILNSINSYDKKDTNWVVLMVFISILFNPVVPVSFVRETWIIIDIIVAFIMFLYYSKNK